MKGNGMSSKAATSLQAFTSEVGTAGLRPALVVSSTSPNSTSSSMNGGTRATSHHVHHHHGGDSLGGSKHGGTMGASEEGLGACTSPARSTTLLSLLLGNPTVFPFVVKPNPNRFALKACFEVVLQFPSQLDAGIFSSTSVASPSSTADRKGEAPHTEVVSTPGGAPTPTVANAAQPASGFKSELYTLRHHFEALVSASQCHLSHKRDEMQSRHRHLSVFHEYVRAAEEVLNERYASSFLSLLPEITPTSICSKSTQRGVTAARIELFYLLSHMPLPTLYAAASVFRFGMQDAGEPAPLPPPPAISPQEATAPQQGDTISSASGGDRGAHQDPLVVALVNMAINSCGGNDCCVLPTKIAQDLILFQNSCFHTALSDLQQFNGRADTPSFHAASFLVAWSCAGWCVAKFIQHMGANASTPMEPTTTANVLSSLVSSSIAATRQLAACFSEDIQGLCAQVKELATTLKEGGTGSTAGLVKVETALSLERLGLDVEWDMLRGGADSQSRLLRTAQSYMELFHRCTVQLPVTHPLTASVAMNAADALAYLAAHHKDVSRSILECPCEQSDDDDQGHQHISGRARLYSSEHEDDMDDDRPGTYRGLMFAAQRFGGCLDAASRFDQVAARLSPSNGSAHGDLGRLLSDAASTLLRQYIRVIQVSVPTQFADAVQALPSSTYELIRIIEGAIATMESTCRAGDDSPNFDLSLSNTRSNAGVAVSRAAC
jgi:hypothetical protein